MTIKINKSSIIISTGFIQNVNGYLFRGALVICEPGNGGRLYPERLVLCEGY